MYVYRYSCIDIDIYVKKHITNWTALKLSIKVRLPSCILANDELNSASCSNVSALVSLYSSSSRSDLVRGFEWKFNCELKLTAIEGVGSIEDWLAYYGMFIINQNLLIDIYKTKLFY